MNYIFIKLSKVGWGYNNNIYVMIVVFNFKM